MTLIQTPVFRESLTRVLVLSRSLLTTSMLIYLTNGELSTHALAMNVILTSAAQSPENTGEEQIRQKKGRYVQKTT